MKVATPPRILDWIEKTSAVEDLEYPEAAIEIKGDKDLTFVEPSPERLTKEALVTMEAAGSMGPPSTKPSTKSAQTNTSDPSSINAYHGSYPRELRLRKIYPAEEGVTLPPSNIDSLMQAMKGSPSTPVPNDSETQNLRYMLAHSVNEASTIDSLLPMLLPIVEDMKISKEDTNVSEQQWARTILLPSSKFLPGPNLTAPKPDRTFGFKAAVFPHDIALAAMGTYAAPATNAQEELIWPYFTVEGKGQGGKLRIARLQSLHNSAIMLNNLLQLRKAVGKEDVFYNKSHVMSLELTVESIHLSCYWAIKEASTVKFYGQCVGCWTPNDPTGAGYREARRCVGNALVWTRDRLREWVAEDMRVLEGRLVAGVAVQITPPASERSGRRKRSKSEGERERERSSSAGSMKRWKVVEQE